jgi:hypothetical protein
MFANGPPDFQPRSSAVLDRRETSGVPFLVTLPSPGMEGTFQMLANICPVVGGTKE